MKFDYLIIGAGSAGCVLANRLSENSQNEFPIIGVGGIHSAKDALEKMEAGADLVQIYTGFIYEGPGLVKKINKAVLNTI